MCEVWVGGSSELRKLRDLEGASIFTAGAWACDIQAKADAAGRCIPHMEESCSGGSSRLFCCDISFSEDLGRSPSSEDLGAFSRRSPDDDLSYKAGTCVESVDIRRGRRKTCRTLYLCSQIK